ncbi:hypothetical protein KJ765_05025 [Candidatus Micrarchaeota archaeon]|nr:hypothetical protein [Candidatus Micrarchaeota archaeon]
MEQNTVYYVLIVLAAIAFFLQVEWIFLAVLFMFFALMFSRAYSAVSNRAAPPALVPPQDPGQLPSQPPVQQPIIVMSGGNFGIGDAYLATTMGMFSALDAYEKRTQAPWHQFLSRGSQMRQNMFGHRGEVGTKHQAMRRDVTSGRVKSINKRLDRIEKSLKRY